MEQSSTGASLSTSELLCNTLKETTQKVEASVLVSIEQHLALICANTSNGSSSSSAGLDFLDVKNSLLLSYLIEITVYLRHCCRKLRSGDCDPPPASLIHRLAEQRAALDRLRTLDHKLRYQIDKLLQSHATASSYAVATTRPGTVAAAEDPLEYRPDAEALMDDDGSRDSDESSSDDEDGGDNGVNQWNSDSGSENRDEKGREGEEEVDDNVDRDLAAARLTVTLSKHSKSSKAPDRDDTAVVYRAPRLSAVPYVHDTEDRQARRDEQARRRLRASELAAAVRYHASGGDAPEVDDLRGGADLGRQRETARRWAEREREKTAYEEEAMVRLTRTRQEKQQQKRLMRQETSNLSAIADLGNLVRGMDAMMTHQRQDSRRGRDEEAMELPDEGRYSNGKRKRGQQGTKKSNQTYKPNNPLQAALFGPGKKGGGGGKRGKKKRHHG